MPSRRDALGAVGVILAGSTAGCLDSVPFLGDEPIGFEAATASVSQSVLDETGYEEHRRRDVGVERTYEVGGQSQDVVVTNRQVEYDKAVDLASAGIPVEQRQRAAFVTTLSTPQVDVLGQTFNPVGDMDSEDLAAMVQDRYAGFSGMQSVGQEAATMAGQSTTVGEFEAEADLTGGGVTVNLTLHIAEAVEAGSDFVVGIGAYPTRLQEQESADVFAMFDGIVHGE